MMNAVGSPQFRSDASWVWTDSAPWCKRTVTQEFKYQIKPQYAEWYANNGTFYYDTGWFRATLESYDTDNYKSPVNVRASVSVADVYLTAGGQRYFYTPKVALNVTSGANDTYICSTGHHSECIINYPLRNPDTDFYWVKLGMLFDTDLVGISGVTMTEDSFIHLTITYDIYYRDESAEPQTLPPSWTEDTTAAPNTAVSLPTVTTTVTNVAEQADEFITPPQDVLDGIRFVKTIVGQLFELKYMTFLICFGIICALLAWLLH